MLDLLEKFAIGVGGFFAFLTVGLYLNLFSLLGIPTGVPSTTSKEFIGGVEEVQKPKTTKPNARSSQTDKQSEEESRIIAQLKKQARRIPASGLQTKELKVPRDLYEYVAAEANWLSEINKAHSDVVKTPNGNTRLKVYNIDEGSMLEKFGFQDHDVIDLIDGEIIEFDERSTHKYHNLAKELLDKLRDGGEISVTVTRRNRPTHIKFSLQK